VDHLNQSPIFLRNEHLQELINLAQTGQPQEICGIITGKDQTSLEIIPIKNISPTPNTNFLMAPEELLDAFIKIDEQKLEHLAFFHSHPRSAPVPSATDLAQAYYPDIPMIIIGKQNKTWEIKAYLLSKVSYNETLIKKLT